ncbi:MAG: hypothetical protein SFU53_14270 [Terrimicrobiaceae bacterium]|nr:hypothetical protein [Terrimicrobiaceae bacterium]
MTSIKEFPNRLVLGLAACLLAAPVAEAQTLYWDINGPTSGASNSADAGGTWATINHAAWGSAASWSTSPNGTSSTQLWPSGASVGASAVFSAGTNATGTHYVTLQGLITVNQIQVNQGNVVLFRGTQGSNTSFLSATRFHVAPGASLELQAVPRHFASPTDFLKSGGGLMIWNSHPSTDNRIMNTLRVGGPLNLTNGLEFRPQTVEVGTNENGSLDLTAAGRIVQNNMSTSPGLNNVVLGRDPGISGSLLVSGRSSVFDWASNMIVGLGGNGTLTINSGGRVSGYSMFTRMILAANPGSSGEVVLNSGGELTLAGPESLVQGQGTAILRLAGGRLNLFPGGNFVGAGQPFSGNVPVTLSGVSTISSGNSTFSGPISGNGSVVFQGWFPDIMWNLTFTGNHSYTGTTTIASSQVGFHGGNARLSGAASVVVGTTGNASLSVSNGGRVQPVGFVRLGAATGGNATVSGLGSELITGTFLEVGNGGAGTLDITSGGRVVSTTTSALGVLPSSLGPVNVEGFGGAITPVGSSWEVGTSLLVGYQSTGIVNIENGGTVTVGEHIELGSIAGGSGVVELETGGTLRVGGTNGIRVGSGIGAIALKGGTLKPHQSALTATAPMSLTNVSTLETGPFSITLNGTLSGAGGLLVTGPQPVFLNAVNSYSGGTTVIGKLVVPAGHALGSGSVDVSGGS